MSLTCGALRIVRPEDLSAETAIDLPCGMSIYVGYNRRDFVWHWEVTGEGVDERGSSDEYERARTLALKTARSLLSGSALALRGK